MDPTTTQTHPESSDSATDLGTDNMKGAFVPPATPHIQVVGGTGAADPIIGTTVGGLSPIFAMATGVTSNIISLARTEALLRTLSFTSTTSRGTVLDEIEFNPWSSSCVNTAAAIYAAAHAQFEGSVNISYETVSNSSLLGSIGVAYVPSVYPKSLVVTPENLYLFDHAIMNVSSSGKGTFTMKPTTADSFVVRRDDDKFYGKLVLLAFTDISNTYGTTMNIPLNVYSKLGPDAHFSAFLPSIIPSVPSEARSELGLLPIFPKTLNSTLVTENSETFNYDILEKYTTEYFVRDNFADNQWDCVTNSGTTTNVTTNAIWGAVPNITYKANDVTYQKRGEVEKSFEVADYLAVPVKSDGGFVLPDIWNATKLRTGFQTAIEYEPSVGKKSRDVGYVPLAGGDEVLVDAELTPHSTAFANTLCHNSHGQLLEAYSTLYDSEVTVPVSGANKFIFKTATNKPDDFLVKSGRIQSSFVAPIGYRALRIVDNGTSIPGVQPGVAGETLPYGTEQVAFMKGIKTFLANNQATKSLTYTINYTNGDLIADVLVNKYGMWTSSVGMDPYALFLGELSFSVEQVTRNTVEWARLRATLPTFWGTRLFTARGVRRVGNRILNNVQPEMMAAILGGAAMGVGSSLGDIGERKFLKKMQDARFKQQIELLKGKNKLAQADFARKYGSQKAMMETEQTRSFRGPGSSEEQADASPFNPAWDKEIKSKPGLYGSVAPHKPNDAAIPPPAAQTHVTHGTDTSFPPPPVTNVTHGKDSSFPDPPPPLTDEADTVHHSELPGKSAELESFMDKMAEDAKAVPTSAFDKEFPSLPTPVEDPPNPRHTALTVPDTYKVKPVAQKGSRINYSDPPPPSRKSTEVSHFITQRNQNQKAAL